MNPNQVQMMGVVRIILSMVLSPLIAKGWIDGNSIEVLTSALASIVIIGWSIWSHSHGNMVKDVTDIHPGVEVLVPHAVTNDNAVIKSMVEDPAQPQVRQRPPEPPSFKPPDFPRAA